MTVRGQPGRKTKIVTVPAFNGTANRDFGQMYQIKEWSAAEAEDWGNRMMFAYNRNGGSLPLDVRGLGMEGVVILGINTFLRGNIQSDEILPLWNRLLDCVQIIRDSRNPSIATPLVSDDDIQEVATRLWLRSEVLELHTGFSMYAAMSALISRIMTKSPDSLSM